MSKKLNWQNHWLYGQENERETFKATIFEDYADFENVPRQLDEFIAFIAKIRDSIPSEHRGRAVITLCSEDGEYGHRADFEIYTTRLETDEEYAERKAKEIATERAAATKAERAERTYYERLKQKYGP